MFSQLTEWFNNAGNQMTNGYNGAFDEMKVSVDDTLDTFQQMGEKAVESGSKAVQTGLRAFFIFPNFIRHSIDPQQQKKYQHPLSVEQKK